jgi:DNA-binding response OmpR family regulator
MTTLVLLIDSDIPFMVNIKKALEDTGQFRVSLAANGPAAEDALRRVAHDVAVVDFDVSDRDIMELLRLLRNAQPGLPVIVAPHTNLQAERTQFLDIQGVIDRPYTARSLIPYIREVLGSGRPQAHITPPAAPLDRTDDFAEPEIPAALRDLFPQDAEKGGLLGNEARRQLREQLEFLDSGASADLLEEFEAIERAQNPAESPETRILHGDPDQTRYLGDDDEPRAPGSDPHQTRYLEDDEPLVPGSDPGQTRYLGDDDEPRVPGSDPHQTRYLGDDDQSLSAQEPRAPHTVDDTNEFGEVLDAVAQSEPPEYERSPDDRAFHDLVDSMREPPSPERRTWLEDLLSAIGADAARNAPEGEGALDYVLDTIRRSSPPVPSGESDLDDTTIGAVIDGLFDPSFEGVLAAMSGEDISDSSYEEPTYTAAGNHEPDEERKLDDDEAGDGESPVPPPEESQAPVIEEPSVSAEDCPAIPPSALTG